MYYDRNYITVYIPHITESTVMFFSYGIDSMLKGNSKNLRYILRLYGPVLESIMITE